MSKLTSKTLICVLLRVLIDYSNYKIFNEIYLPY